METQPIGMQHMEKATCSGPSLHLDYRVKSQGSFSSQSI